MTELDCELDDRKTAGNSTFAMGGVSCSADTFVQAESSVLRMNICAKKPAHRKSAKRFGRLHIIIKRTNKQWER
jgi:hypothetical protein